MHLLNIVNVKLTYFEREPADLFVLDSARISKKMIATIQKKCIFNRVVFLPMVPETTSDLKYRISLLQKLHVAHVLQSHLYQFKKNVDSFIDGITYNRMFISNFGVETTPWLVAYLLSKNTKLKISIIEEGAGDLYKNKDQLFCLSSRKHVDFFISCLLHTKIHKSELIKIVDEIYLYVPEVYSSDTHLKTLRIPCINLNFSLFNDLFLGELNGLDIDDYLKRPYIYLSSSNVTQGDYDGMYKEVDILCSEIPMNKIIIKDHPRSFSPLNLVAYERYIPDIYVDSRNYFLEAIYAYLNLSDKVLITYGSATVLHPKYLFGKEPYVIFTFNVYSNSGSLFTKKVADDLLKLYSDKNKIYVPNSLDEFHHILLSIQSKFASQY